MKKNPWLPLFFLSALGDLAGIQTANGLLQYICKPLLLLSLTGYFISSAKPVNNTIKRVVLMALLFSWVGDLLLLFEAKDPVFFLAGLSAFLLAHIFYILFFHRIRMMEKVKANPRLLIIVVVYYTGLIYFLSPYLGKMKLPVRIYGIVISFMFMLAMHMLSIRNRKAGRYMMGGALLFVLSDSLLALNKFYRGFEMAGILIMLTYAGAQFFITEGAIRYLRERELRAA